MTLLAWDQTGERRYETGVDRGVLYHPDGYVVPWNGLTSVADNTSREVTDYFLDGVKVLGQEVVGAFEGKISAFTYPDELESCLGLRYANPGIRIHDQKGLPFSVSYRTKIGTDLNADLGYKLHVLYNVLATPSDTEISTISDTPEATEFSWDLTSTPQSAPGFRRTSHVSFDSRHMSPTALAAVEAVLYDDAESLPNLADLLTLASSS